MNNLYFASDMRLADLIQLVGNIDGQILSKSCHQDFFSGVFRNQGGNIGCAIKRNHCFTGSGHAPDKFRSQRLILRQTLLRRVQENSPRGQRSQRNLFQKSVRFNNFERTQCSFIRL